MFSSSEIKIRDLRTEGLSFVGSEIEDRHKKFGSFFSSSPFSAPSSPPITTTSPPDLHRPNAPTSSPSSSLFLTFTETPQKPLPSLLSLTLSSSPEPPLKPAYLHQPCPYNHHKTDLHHRCSSLVLSPGTTLKTHRSILLSASFVLHFLKSTTITGLLNHPETTILLLLLSWPSSSEPLSVRLNTTNNLLNSLVTHPCFVSPFFEHNAHD